MCLIALALDHDRRFPLVVAANRDEFFDRPAARLAWWQPKEGAPPILSGRDLTAGGTWMGLTTAGRLAMVTNVRSGEPPDPAAPSRGHIVSEWLSGDERPDRFWARTALSGHNGFNLIAADFRQGECFWASNRAPYPRRLERGIHSLSNAGLDTPWPKVVALKQRLASAVKAADSVDGLIQALFEALADRSQAPDDQLPQTGVSTSLERQLSAAFIRTPDGRYGTRCSTVIVSHRVRRQTVTHVFERTYSGTGGVALLRRSQLSHWPPRYQADGAAGGEESVPLAGEVSDVDGAYPPPPQRPATTRRTRISSLLKPDAARIRRGTG